MHPSDLLLSIRAQLAHAADPRFRESLLWFFKEKVDPYGVRSPEIRKIVQSAYPEVKRLALAERNRLMEDLWRSGKVEEGVVAAHLYRRFKKQCGSAEFRMFERWLDRYIGNWANCDGVSTWLLAACIENEPKLIECLAPWTASKNRWKRRASIVALLQEAKKGRNTAVILDIAGRLLEDPDDMVQKGVGWVLKEAYPRRPSEVLAFLGERGRNAPRLVLRIAAEKMTAADRARALTPPSGTSPRPPAPSRR